jgi:hypothetical protein
LNHKSSEVLVFGFESQHADSVCRSSRFGGDGGVASNILSLCFNQRVDFSAAQAARIKLDKRAEDQ